MWDESLNSARKEIDSNAELLSQIQNTSQKEVVKAFNQAYLLKMKTIKVESSRNNNKILVVDTSDTVGVKQKKN